MSGVYGWAAEKVVDGADALFGDGNDTGLLGTGHRRTDKYDVNKDSFTNSDSEENQQMLKDRLAGVDGRTAQQMGTTQIGANERAGTAQAGPAAQGSLALANGQTISRGEDAEMRQYQTALAQQLLAQTQGKGPAFDLANNSYRQANEQAVKNMMGTMAATGGAVNPAMAQRNLINAQESIEVQNAQALANDRLRAQMAAQQQLGGVVQGARAQDIGVNTDQAGLLNQVALANMGASNDMSKFNAGQSNQQRLSDAQLRQQTMLFNAGETNDTNALQAQLDQQAKQANLEAYFKQQGLNDEMARYYTNQQMQQDEADRAAQMAYEQLKVTQEQGINQVESQDYNSAAGRKASMMGGAVDTGVSLASSSDRNAKENIYTVSSENEKSHVRKGDNSGNYSSAEVKAAMAWKKRMDSMAAQRKADSAPGMEHARLGHALGNLFSSLANGKPKNADTVLSDMANQQDIRNRPIQNSNYRGFETGAMATGAQPASQAGLSSRGGAMDLGSMAGEPAPPPSQSSQAGFMASALMDASAPSNAGASMRGAPAPAPMPAPSNSHRAGFMAGALGADAGASSAGQSMSPGTSVSSFDMKSAITPVVNTNRGGSSGFHASAPVSTSGSTISGAFHKGTEQLDTATGGMDVLSGIKWNNNEIAGMMRDPTGGMTARGFAVSDVGAKDNVQPYVLSDERAKKDAFEAGVLYADASSAQRSGHKVDDKHLELPDYIKPKKSADSGFAIRAVDRDEPGRLSPNPATSPMQKIPDETSPTGWRYAEPMIDGAPNRTSAQASPTFAAQQAQAASDKAWEDRPFFDQNFMQQYVDDPAVRTFTDALAPIVGGPIGGAAYAIRRTQRDYNNAQANKPAPVKSDERIKTGVSEADASAFGGPEPAKQDTASPSLGDQTFTGSYQAKQEQSDFAAPMDVKTTQQTAFGGAGTTLGQDPWTKRASYIDNLRMQQAPAQPGSGEVARYGGSTMRPVRNAAIDRAHADQVAQYQQQLTSLGQQLQDALRRMREAEQRASAASTVQPIVQAAPTPAPAPSYDIPANPAPIPTGGAGGSQSNMTYEPSKTYSPTASTTTSIGARSAGDSDGGLISSNTGLAGAYTAPWTADTSYRSSGGGSRSTSWSLSDERQKTKKQKGRDPDVQQFIDTLVPSTYDYKDPDMPGAGHGRQFGLMAQDLERTTLGRSAVKEDPTGTKVVDYGKLGGINMALGVMNAQHADKQDERIANLEKALELAMKRKR